MPDTEIPQEVKLLARQIAEEMAQGQPVSAAPTASLEFAVAFAAASRAIMADRASRAPDPSRDGLVETPPFDVLDVDTVGMWAQGLGFAKDHPSVHKLARELDWYRGGAALSAIGASK